MKKFKVFNSQTKGMYDWEHLATYWTLEDFDIINKGDSKSVILQFTGLKDKNGKEIYEGDIVIPFSLENKMNKSVIVYEFKEFRIKGESLYWNWDLRQIEIIGNIYENPELI